MNKSITVGYFHPSNSFTAGSSQSLVKLVEKMNSNGVNSFVILSRKGNIEKVLKERGIKYYVINDYANNYWTKITTINKKSFRFVVEYAIKSILNYIQIVRAAYRCKKEKVDVIHINTLTCCQGAYVARLLKKPFVWHIRECMEEDLGVEFVNIDKAKKIVNKASCIISVSNAVKAKFDNVFCDNKIKTIYNGVSADKYYKEREIFQDSNRITIVITGRVNEKKGQHELLSALSYIDDEYKKRIRCYIIGELLDEKYSNRLKKIIELNNLEDIVQMIGFTDHIETYLAKADIMCVCSAMEAFGRVTVEGMQAGCLVIGANAGGTSELIDDCKTGLLYEAGNSQGLSDCIKFAMQNVSNSKIMAKNGQKVALSLFTDQLNMEKVKQVYEEIVR